MEPTMNSLSENSIQDNSGELSDQDLEKVSGGRGTRPDPILDIQILTTTTTTTTTDR